MKTTRMLLLTGVTTALGVLGNAATAPVHAGPVIQPMIVRDVAGTLRIQQSLPGTCDNVDQTTPVTGGRIEMSPADGIDAAGGKQFTLLRANATFGAFTIERHCMTQDVTKHYTGVGVHLVRAAPVAAVPVGAGVYTFTIPRTAVILYQGARVNGELEPGYMEPKEDVTGTIDYTQRTFSMRVAVQTKLHFEFGCIPHVGCAVNEDRFGTLTATLTGTVVLPDSDGDGVADQQDNCRFTANPDQSPVATPVVTAPAPVTLASCLDAQIGSPIVTDVCDAGPVTASHDAPAQFAIGPNTVTWTGRDAKLRTGTAQQTVTVVDQTKPAFTFVPLNIQRNDCGPVDLGTPAGTDDCAGAVSFSHNGPAIFLNGPTLVTWTARDVSGNTAEATQTVTVNDTTPPQISCVPTAPGGYFRVVAEDACLGPTAIQFGTYSVAPGEVVKIEETGLAGVRLVNVTNGVRHFLVGRGDAVMTAVDESGNSATVVCR